MYIGWILAIVFGGIAAISFLVLVGAAASKRDTDNLGMVSLVIALLAVWACIITCIITPLDLCDKKKAYNAKLNEYEYLKTAVANSDDITGVEYAIYEYNSWVASAKADVATWGVCSKYISLNVDALEYVDVTNKDTSFTTTDKANAKAEVEAKRKECELLMTNGYNFGWAAVQEHIGEYNRWVVAKQTEVELLGDKSVYYYTDVMTLKCITGWGITE